MVKAKPHHRRGELGWNFNWKWGGGAHIVGRGPC